LVVDVSESPGLLSRFQSDGGQGRLVEVLLRHRLTSGSAELAERIAATGQLLEIPDGTVLIQEDARTDELFLLLAGSLSVRVRGTEVARRGPGDFVGEQALLDPVQKRTATVTAIEPCALIRLAEAQIEEIARAEPTIWRNIARELSRKLIARNEWVRGANEQVQVFIICSKEALWIAEEVRSRLNHGNVLCTLWTDGIFRASMYPLEALEAALDDKDFAIAVAAPDDFVETRGERHVTPRDNVIFELGLFVGRIGRQRTILLEPRDEDVKLPSDLAGLPTVPYRNGPREKLPTLLGGACHEILKLIEALRAIDTHGG
jgi:CRP/FNR family cyclic AMP-dependent transcriptional regulator